MRSLLSQERINSAIKDAMKKRRAVKIVQAQAQLFDLDEEEEWFIDKNNSK